MEKKNLLNVDHWNLVKQQSLPAAWWSTEEAESPKRLGKFEKTRKYLSNMRVVNRYIENLKGLVAASKQFLRKPNAVLLKKLQ